MRSAATLAGLTLVAGAAALPTIATHSPYEGPSGWNSNPMEQAPGPAVPTSMHATEDDDFQSKATDGTVSILSVTEEILPEITASSTPSTSSFATLFTRPAANVESRGLLPVPTFPKGWGGQGCIECPRPEGPQLTAWEVVAPKQIEMPLVPASTTTETSASHTSNLGNQSGSTLHTNAAPRDLPIFCPKGEAWCVSADDNLMEPPSPVSTTSDGSALQVRKANKESKDILPPRPPPANAAAEEPSHAEAEESDPPMTYPDDCDSPTYVDGRCFPPLFPPWPWTSQPAPEHQHTEIYGPGCEQETSQGLHCLAKSADDGSDPVAAR